jgi:hypothetical protein
MITSITCLSSSALATCSAAPLDSFLPLAQGHYPGHLVESAERQARRLIQGNAMQLITVKIEKPDKTNFILGQTHFIKSVEDIHKALVAL